MLEPRIAPNSVELISGIPMTQTITIHDLYISSGHDFKGRFGKTRLNHETPRVELVECVEGKGIVGDRYFGYKEKFKGQLSLISLEAIQEMENELGISVEEFARFRRNAVVSGVDLNALVGKTFTIGDVKLHGTEQCKPCFWMDESIGEGANAALEDRGGLRCHILSSGSITCGETTLELIC